MIGLLQRVSKAWGEVAGQNIGEIGPGLLVLVGVEKGDTEVQADRLLERLLGYRVFADDEDKMNLSVMDISGSVLMVPQFTLAADTQKGLRPGFSNAASPEKGLALFTQLIDIMRVKGNLMQGDLPADWLQTGQFGADMAVELLNDGPVNFNLTM